MTPSRLDPADARTLWTSALIPNDQFLLYCFDHAGAAPAPTRWAARSLAARAASLPELRVRVAEVPGGLDYPYWVRSDVVDVQTHQGGSWPDVRDAVAALFADQLDARVAAWRLHLFGPVEGAPRCTGRASIVVFQVSHALADGRGASAAARRLFVREPPGIGAALPSRWGPVAAAAAAARGGVGIPTALVQTVFRGLGAGPARSDLDRRTRAGSVPAPAPLCPPTSLNVRPGTGRDVRLAVRTVADLTAHGTTVTVGGMTAISLALERLLESRGEAVPSGLSAEVTVARPTRGGERNSFGNASVPLHPGTPIALRRRLIARSLGAARQRAADPAWARIAAADRSAPAVLVRMGLHAIDIDVRPATVGGATVVSSVARGAADLVLGNGRVAFTAGFPALSPLMGVTHGIHGIGDVVTITVTSARTALPDPDGYAELLGRALDEVRGPA